MSKLLDKLADDIVALINSKMRSPTKAEIVETLRASSLSVVTAEAEVTIFHPSHPWYPPGNDSNEMKDAPIPGVARSSVVCPVHGAAHQYRRRDDYDRVCDTYTCHCGAWTTGLEMIQNSP